MKSKFLFWRGPIRRMSAGLAGVGLAGAAAHGQLAITEVMSHAATNHGAAYVLNQSDFWELTNFGTNDIDLAGYTFADRLETPMEPLVRPGDLPLMLGAGKSVVFVRHRETTNEAQFRAWWGDCLDTNVEVRMAPSSPGFDEAEDGIRLWDSENNLVDLVDFGVARRGVTFVSDPDSGEFGNYSEPGDGATCQAATADDWGSPGKASGPYPLHITQEPTNQVVCTGGEATFAVRATGLPRPRFQWFFNGSAIPGATAASYTVANALPANEGAYHADVYNGLEIKFTTPATLAVTTNLSAPSLVTPPVDIELYTGQTARFSVSVCAYPPASYQWLSNSVPMPGATDRVLLVPDCALSMSGTEFCVRVTNELGTNLVCARLTVTSKPEVRITEMMASANADCGQHADWFELTNFGTNTVNLLGYRFSDRNALATARVVTEAVLLSPGQSAILVEGMTPQAFGQWWGAGNLPPGLAVIPYVGLGFSAERGEEIYLWNAAATTLDDKVNSVSFGTSLRGVSQWFAPDEASFCYFSCDSVVSEMGAFRAVECGDIGSPGYTANGPPRLVSVTRGASGARIMWHGIEGRTNRLEYNAEARATGWVSLDEMVATNSLPVKVDPGASGAGRRFYRVLELAP